MTNYWEDKKIIAADPPWMYTQRRSSISSWSPHVLKTLHLCFKDNLPCDFFHLPAWAIASLNKIQLVMTEEMFEFD